MSTISNALASLRPQPRGPQCSVGALLDRLRTDDPAGHDALVASIDNLDIPAIRISQALAEIGIKLHRDTIVRHRRRARGTGCRCES